MKKETTSEGTRITFPCSLWLNGNENKDGSLTITDMYYEVTTEQRKGNARRALDELNKVYSGIYASEVTDEAEPFWLKMIEEKRIVDIVGYWDE